MRALKPLGVIPLVLLGFSGTASGQNAGSVELGYDVSAELWILDDIDETLLSVGVPGGGMFIVAPQKIRIGYLVSEAGEIEFPVGFSLYNDEGDTIWNLGTGLYGVYNFRKPGSGTIPFLRGGGLINVLGDGGDASTQFSLGGSVGVRQMMSDRLAWRFGLGVERSFESDDFRGHTDLSFDVGLSFFTPGRPNP